MSESFLLIDAHRGPNILARDFFTPTDLSRVGWHCCRAPRTSNN